MKMAGANFTVIKHKNPGKLEEASTHKSANTHAGNVFVTLDLGL